MNDPNAFAFSLADFCFGFCNSVSTIAFGSCVAFNAKQISVPSSKATCKFYTKNSEPVRIRILKPFICALAITNCQLNNMQH